MLRVTLTIEGEVVIDRLLEGLEERAKNLRLAWPALVRVFRQIARQAFDTEGQSTGDAWPQLAVRTVDDRRRKGFGPEHPILQRTQKLMRSLVIGSDGGYTVMNDQSLEIGTNVEYFRYHQSNKPRFKLPRRAPILLTADDRHELFRPIRLHLTGRDPNAPQRARVG